jgi:hypothetical protein
LGIGRRLNPEKFCLRPNRPADLINLRHIDEAHLETPPNEDVAQQLCQPVVNISRGDDVIARRQGLQDRARRGQTGTKRGGVLAAFQRSQTLLERLARWVRASSVDVPVGITSFGITLEGGGEMNWRRHRARRRINGVPGVHRQCLDPDLGRILHSVLLYCRRLAQSRRTTNGDRAPLLQRGTTNGDRAPLLQRGTTNGDRASLLQRGTTNGDRAPLLQRGSKRFDGSIPPAQIAPESFSRVFYRSGFSL